jgi:signal recognition particle GTPase
MVSLTQHRLEEWWHRCLYTEREIYLAKREINVYDFYDYLKRMNKAGVLGAWMHNLPGFHLDPTPLQVKEGRLFIKKFRRLLRKMDEKDAKRPDLIPFKKLAWLARKSRVSIEDVRLMLDRFEDMRFYARIYKNRVLKQ